MNFPSTSKKILRKLLSEAVGVDEVEEPIRAEMFSIERLEQHAASLAAGQRISASPRKGRRLLRRVVENRRVLVEAYRAIARAIREERSITPAAEWLADNFHIVEEQLREILDDLPPSFYRELPKLTNGPLEGYPRVFGLVWEFVAHTDSRFDAETLRRFLLAYQQVQPLSIAELWAVAISLRVVLVENLRRLADGITIRRAARQEADALADSLLGVGGKSTEPASAALREFQGAPLQPAFAVQLVQRLRDLDPAVTPSIRWLEDSLSAQGTTPDEMVRLEHQRQAAMNVTVRNIITSMRLLSTFDWAEFFESVSPVDAMLRAIPSFAAMDFATRDSYRRAIEELSRGSPHSEIEVARRVILQAQRFRFEGPAGGGQREDRLEDPGYYLISKGREAFERELGYRVQFKTWLLRTFLTEATSGYLGTIAGLSGLILALFLFLAGAASGGALCLALLALAALLPASDLAIALVNRAVTALLGPQKLPKLELRDGVPPELRTLIVVPNLLTHRAEIEEHIDRLEVHYLSNPDNELRFALLSDWTDAPLETMPEDEELLAAAVGGIARLNKRHGPLPDGGERFYLFHRRRGWNEGERKWIGWERKRGKLHELNRLLRGATDTTFIPADGRAPAAPPGIRFVITLDSDTRLPRGAASRLIGTLAHSLNRPKFDPRKGRVVEGYAVLQPRVTPAIPADREGSVFQWIFSGPCGTDPYVSAVSDVYQDLFAEGSYTGKGIYEVDAFEAALAGLVPENALLSHDLFEGIFVRAGLVTDIEVFDEFPSHYSVAAARQHRWARGDWQLLPWIFGRASGADGGRKRVMISPINRWKMLDNLRRTLSAPAAFLALVAGWALPIGSPGIWTASILATLLLPAFMPFLGGLIPHRTGISRRSHFRAVGRDLLLAVSYGLLEVTLLPHQAWLMADAVLRTLVRLYVTRRRLLEWVTAAQSKSGSDLTLSSFTRRMAGALALAAAAAVLVTTGNPEAWPVAAPFFLLWVISPLAALWISLPPVQSGPKPLADADARVLRLIARKTWRYFETFVGPEDHHLPPDNFQEEPRPVVAHRTSPTNMGVYLLSTIAAHDFGWTGTLGAVERLEATLETMNGLERFRGHFYNWYATRDLRPLDPKYISSVDSGNLAGHLIAAGRGCRQIIDRPLLGPASFSGIQDDVHLVRESALSISDGRRTQVVTRKQLDEVLDAIAGALQELPRTPADWVLRLQQLKTLGHTAADVVRTLSGEENPGAGGEAVAWVEAVLAGIESRTRDLEAIFPWARLLLEDVQSGRSPALDQTPIGKIIESRLSSLPPLHRAAETCEAAIAELTQVRANLASAADSQTDLLARIDELIDGLARSAEASGALVRRLLGLSRLARGQIDAMEFGFLFNPVRKLLSLGFAVAEGQLDPICYDLLASEAQLTSFVAIAKGDVPTVHWFHLGRVMTPLGWGSALVSWSGSMFEYLMPLLVMRYPASGLIAQTHQLIVQRQIKYAAACGVPWGISESAYNARDLELTYQYTNFGVPGLGLKRGLSENLVVAPYATALAAMVDPAAAVRNFARLASAGAAGRYGFYEAMDYTAARLPEGRKVAIVRAFMSHHQGMALVAIANILHDGAMRSRFHDEPRIQATELLLQERMPRDVLAARPRVEEARTSGSVRDFAQPVPRRFSSPHTRSPGTQLLSNGRYSVMVTTAGSGYSRWRNLAVTRWREDTTRDSWGSYVFLRDSESGEVWSAAYQPSAMEPDSYEASFSEDRVEFRRRDGTIATTLEIVVSQEDDAEVRRVTVTNTGPRVRELELTSYAELVLAPPAADAAHPAFSNLFVQTEFLPELDALIATRRPRSHDEPQIWAAHVLASEGEMSGPTQCETDRARFLGRGRELRRPLSVSDGRQLSGTAGAVLDPIASLRRNIRLEPGATARLTFSTIIAPSRQEALDLADEYRDPASYDRASTLAWTQAQIQLRHLGIGPDEARLFQDLAGCILYSNSSLRPSAGLPSRDTRGPSALWGHGISGDLPIILARIDAGEDRDFIRQLLLAHEYWRMKQLAVDLVILNEQAPSYEQSFLSSLEARLRASQSSLRPEGRETPGGVFILRADHVSGEDRSVLQTVARAVLSNRRGSLADQVAHRQWSSVPDAPLPRRQPPANPVSVPAPRPNLEFFNGLGGFDANGREYVTILGEGQWTPAPWINVIANQSFGFQVSESGSGYTWSMNSRENKLTPWSNDPVSDPPGETLYIRDEESGDLWGPTALPIREETAPYIARHGPGYSRFEHESHGIALDLVQFVPVEDPVKICRLSIQNHSRRHRRLSVTAYVEWVLGVSRSSSAPHIITEIDRESGAMFATNAWNGEFAGRLAFADLGGRQTAWTGSRAEFLGRHGSLDRPAALERGYRLSGKTGAGLDPCCVLQTTVDLSPGGRAEVVFFLGETATAEEARTLLGRCRTANLDGVLGAVVESWENVLGAVQVTTPDRSMNLLLNRWLLYQSLACRIWARSAFYQAGGAYGFRDQLQDVLALILAKPEIARQHLLRAAARQFAEGDVQHWWHPPSGRGVRTRISDDLLWLPYAVCHYLQSTGDAGLLDEAIPFLEGPPVPEGHAESYYQPGVSPEKSTLYEHCARALDRSLAVGIHGLPLIGAGDWNDGMNRIGHQGKGESVWLGWFLLGVLREFAPLAEQRGENGRAETWKWHAVALQDAIEREAWDGNWYRRAYTDDGAPIGSASNEECRIDSIAQSWGVITGAAEPARGARAMAAVSERLVRRGDGLILLFTPPFDRTGLDPGYIKGYLPGVRENGGQYTHAAIWTVIAFAALGDGDKAGELFSILNPIHHASTRAGVHRYKVEPYVLAADVYAEPPHAGRGGWTWYTGSASWMYRAGIEWILGFRRRGSMLHIEPCIPRAWRGFEIAFRHRTSRYQIAVENPRNVSTGVLSVEIDGKAAPAGAPIPLADDGASHRVRIVLGPTPTPPQP